MNRHRKALDKAKPVLDTRTKPCHMPSSKSTALNKDAFFRDYGLVLKTFQAVHRQKAVIDNRAPKAGPSRASRPVRKKEGYEMAQHRLNLKATTLKISEGLRWIDRAKNANDPVSHPVYFIKKAEQLKGVSIDPLVKLFARRPASSKPLFGNDYPSYYRKGKTARHKTRSSLQVESEALRGEADRLQKGDEWQPLREGEIPRVCSSCEEDYVELKGQLQHHVWVNKIYKEDDFRALELRVCLHNPQLEEARVGQMVRQVKAELECYD